jgi:hypothetical protein
MQTNPTAHHSPIGSFQRLCYLVHSAATGPGCPCKLASCTTMTEATGTSIRGHNRSLGALTTAASGHRAGKQVRSGCRSVTMSRVVVLMPAGPSPCQPACHDPMAFLDVGVLHGAGEGVRRISQCPQAQLAERLPVGGARVSHLHAISLPSSGADNPRSACHARGTSWPWPVLGPQPTGKRRTTAGRSVTERSSRPQVARPTAP